MSGEFSGERLRRAVLPSDPMELFDTWFAAAALREPWGGQAVVLATAGSDGMPSARVVLMRGADALGFRFYTRYTSRKGMELAGSPKAALVFWWPSQVRQVRVEGTVRRLDAAASDAYFAARPRESRIGAWGSPQSKPIESRRELEQRVKAVADGFEGRDVPRPPEWGGYIVRPQQIEFWQGGEARLHDRFLYTRTGVAGSGWTISRLAP